jgi:hypothetical protein
MTNCEELQILGLKLCNYLVKTLSQVNQDSAMRESKRRYINLQTWNAINQNKLLTK